MKKDILFLCQFFYPEHNSSATLPFDTAKYLAHHGYSIGALCGWPKEYASDKKIVHTEIVDGVNIRRLKYFQPSRGTKIGRLFNYFSFTASVLANVSELKKYRAVIVYSNPPILPMAAVLANVLYGTKIVFISYDVYPEIAYASGALNEHSPAAALMRRINRSLFKRCAATVALTDEMRSFLIRNRCGLDADKVFTLPNWAHETERGDKGEARREFGFSERDFVVSYFGNIGVCQDETALIQAMEQLGDKANIKFLIIGHGGKIPEVSAAAERLKNVQVHGFMTGQQFADAVAVSSCGIVSLGRGLNGMCAPSKYYSYLRGGLPVLAVAEEDSYLAEEIVQVGIGYVSQAGDGGGLADNIMKLYENEALRREMSARAETLYSENYEKNIGLERYRELAARVLDEVPQGAAL